jgi:chromosome segregation ATPase
LQSLIDFGNAIKDNLIERFDSLLDTFGHLGKALGHLFKGEFSEAFDSVKDAGKESIDIITGVDNSVDKITETATNASKAIKEYAKSTVETATTMVELRKESELAAVKVQGLIEEYDRQAEKLRQVRDDETKTFEERIAANEELGRVLKEQEEQMLKLVNKRIEEAELDKKKNNSLENQIKLEEALNEKKAIQAQITGFQSEQLVNQVSLQKEQTQVALENAEAQLQAYSDLAGALSSLAGENKALAVAQATIDTYAGATKAFAQGGVTGFVSGAAIIAAGLSNIRKILSTDVGSGGGGGGSVPSDTGTPAPEMLSGAFTLGTPEPQPVQAYVVTDDMTNNQNKLANIRRRATI